MNPFDATVHALTTVSTGGFANYDASFGTFSGPIEYAASVFMILAALPFVRYVQLLNGHATPLYRDTQVRAFLLTIVFLVLVTALVLTSIFPHHWEQAFREGLFNITSIISGTGFSSVDYMKWGCLSDCDVLLYRADRWLRRVNHLFGQDLSLSDPVFLDPHPGQAHRLSPWRLSPAL